MNPEELKLELKTLTDNLEGKSKAEVKSALEAFETKNNEFIASQVKEVKESLEAQLKAVQEHADKLDVKLQEKAVNTNNEPVDVLAKTIADNIDSIKQVRAGKSFETKAVADMGVANLTGTAPRTYNFDIVKFPNQKVNIEDFVGSVSAPNGIYTYTVEGAGEGSISAQTENASKSQRDYDFTATDVSTNFIAGFARYSKKMANNVSYIVNTIPMLLRRDYYKAENSAFNTIIAAAATASTEIITGKTKAEMLINEIGKLEDADYSDSNIIIVKPTDYLSILKTAKMDLASAVTYEGGVLRVAGVQVLKASSWLAANKYYVGDWSRVNKIVTEGLSLEFSDQEGSNFVKNQITARIEAQVSLVVEQPAAVIYGDFTAS
jgi:hypothetical protein